MFFLIILLHLNLFSQTTYNITDPEAIEDLVLTAGDTVILADGTYTGDSTLDIYAEGTLSQPITFRPQTPGGVLFTGTMRMRIAGSYVVIDGFHWQGGEGASNFIEFRTKNFDNVEAYAQNCTIQNCVIDGLVIPAEDQADDEINGSITKHRWIVLYGNYNNVLNCTFMNKASAGALILVELYYNDPCQVVGHTISNNYFYNYQKIDSSLSNSGDSETIRVGTSANQDYNCATTVSNNYFVQADGENEIITNKSANNIYTNNTFRRCRGSLVLRHGHNATINKNYFLGENVDGTGGIRIVDSNHTITNNYIQDCVTVESQAKWNNGITFMGGSATSIQTCDTGSPSNGYQKSDNINVSNNTIINTNAPLFFNGDKGTSDNTGSVSNNLIYFETGNTNITTVINEDTAGDYNAFGTTLTYIGNIYGGTTLGQTNVGFGEETISLTADGEIFTHNQTGKGADMGGFEPHTDAMVGNGVGACFLDYQGMPIASPVCTIAEIDKLNVAALSEFSIDGGSQQVTVSANVAWTASESLDWVTISPTSGTGEGDETITVTVEANPETSSRSGIINFSQVGGDLTATLNVSQAAPELTDLFDLINTGETDDPVTVDSYSSYEVAKGSDPSKLLDKDSGTKWTSSDSTTGDMMDDGEYAIYDLGSVESLKLIRFTTDDKDDPYGYQIWVSENGTATSDFTKIIPEANELEFSQAGTTDFQVLEVDVNAKYVKLVGFGRYSVTSATSYTQTSAWTNFTEIEFFREKEGNLSTRDFELNQVSIYPVPAVNELNIVSEKVFNKIVLYSLSGQQLLVDNVQNVNTHRINTTNIKNGVYLLKISGDNNSIITKRVIISH